MKTTNFLTLLILLIASIFVFTDIMVTDADARSRGGGKSFSRRSTPPPVKRSTPPPVPGKSSPQSSNRSSGGGFMQGLAGGMLGGMLGSMLFGGMAHGMGGGFGGSGFGLIELLIIGGIIYFVYSKFIKKKGAAVTGSKDNRSAYSDYSTPQDSSYDSHYDGGLDAPPQTGHSTTPSAAPPPIFNEKEIKEKTQDIFFRIQAAWMHRDINAVKDIAGPEIIALYSEEFEKMKGEGVVNRLENIAIRDVAVVDQGTDNGHEYVKVMFTANLLDYKVNEKTGEVVEGDRVNPVKFSETWTFARTSEDRAWKVYGVDV